MLGLRNGKVLIYEGGGWSTFYGKWVIGLRNGKRGGGGGGGGGGSSFARQGFYNLYSHKY